MPSPRPAALVPARNLVQKKEESESESEDSSSEDDRPIPKLPGRVYGVRK